MARVDESRAGRDIGRFVGYDGGRVSR